MSRSRRWCLSFSVVGVCLAMLASACGSVASTAGTTGEATETPAATSDAGSLPAVMPEDFGFIASYGFYGRDRLNAFEGTFTKDINSQTKPNPTVELRLTDEELASLYQDLRVMRILDYPPNLDQANTGITASTPTSYRLGLRVGGLEKVISLRHGEFTRSPETKALVEWFRKLRGMIEAKPEYRRLPSMERGYM